MRSAFSARFPHASLAGCSIFYRRASNLESRAPRTYYKTDGPNSYFYIVAAAGVRSWSCRNTGDSPERRGGGPARRSQTREQAAGAETSSATSCSRFRRAGVHRAVLRGPRCTMIELANPTITALWAHAVDLAHAPVQILPRVRGPKFERLLDGDADHRRRTSPTTACYR
jgi:hypothetical protein